MRRLIVSVGFVGLMVSATSTSAFADSGRGGGSTTMGGKDGVFFDGKGVYKKNGDEKQYLGTQTQRRGQIMGGEHGVFFDGKGVYKKNGDEKQYLGTRTQRRGVTMGGKDGVFFDRGGVYKKNGDEKQYLK